MLEFPEGGSPNERGVTLYPVSATGYRLCAMIRDVALTTADP